MKKRGKSLRSVNKKEKSVAKNCVILSEEIFKFKRKCLKKVTSLFTLVKYENE